jgi:GH25 family lysozyme M1 (1,4-beta-N-acetylmuramidase)
MSVTNQGVLTQLGADVSNWQGNIDLHGLDFVSAKCSQGTGYHDLYFARNRANAKHNKQPFIAYHFLERGNGKQQAQFFVHLVNLSGGFNDIGAMVDIEKQNKSYGPTLHDVSDFVAEFTRLVPGKTLVFYTGGWYWRGYLGDPTAFAGHPLWDANYIKGSGTPQQLIRGVTPNYFPHYGGWKKHTIRQFSSSGVVNGRKMIDLDEFEGSLRQLADVLHIGYKPPVVTPRPTTPATPSPHLVVDGILAAKTISAMENVLVHHKLLAHAHGVLTHNAIVALQKYLKVAHDGIIGPVTIKALQKHVGAAHDGKWGPDTTRHIQEALNHNKF